jgi:hypothetical protein
MNALKKKNVKVIIGFLASQYFTNNQTDFVDSIQVWLGVFSFTFGRAQDY